MTFCFAKAPSACARPLAPRSPGKNARILKTLPALAGVVVLTGSAAVPAPRLQSEPSSAKTLERKEYYESCGY